MRFSIGRGCLAVFGTAVSLVACQSLAPVGGVGNVFGESSTPVLVHFRGARPSHAWRRFGRIKRLITFPTAIQHVVVIVMENRSLDNLFAGYYAEPWNGPGGYRTWGQALNLHNPLASPTLVPNYLSAPVLPHHSHQQAWNVESLGEWNRNPIGCDALPCGARATVFSYVPTSDTVVYKFLIRKWAFANNVLQSNEGPSFPAHQYLIAGQSGGYIDARSSPDAEAENPNDHKEAEVPHNYIGPAAEDLSSSGCHPRGYHAGAVNMSIPAPTPSPSPSRTPNLDNGGDIESCEEYGATVLDEMAAKEGGSGIDDWQYIAHSDKSVWAAPLGVNHLWLEYKDDPDKGAEPFAVDPDAFNFALNISRRTKASPNPARPFAPLTYITPCEHESDHPEPNGTDHGPEWLGWLINTIGESKYWKSTTIIVTWDDWGGWYDHVPPVSPKPWGIRPSPNPYNNPIDPNEWGFRVPLLVISPYIQARGYISGPAQSFKYRSQGAILQYIEGTFGLPSMHTDDIQQGQQDYLQDVFNFSQSPRAYVPIPNITFSPGRVGYCPNDSNDSLWDQQVERHSHRGLTPPD